MSSNNPKKKSCFSSLVYPVCWHLYPFACVNLQFTREIDYSIDYTDGVQKKNLLILDQRIDRRQMFLSEKGDFFFFVLKSLGKWDIINVDGEKSVEEKAISSDWMRFIWNVNDLSMRRKKRKWDCYLLWINHIFKISILLFYFPEKFLFIELIDYFQETNEEIQLRISFSIRSIIEN